MASMLTDVIREVTGTTDPRVATWPLMGTPVHMACLLIAYVYFCKIFGPRFFKERDPLAITWLVRLHNVSLITFNILIVYSYSTLALFTGNFNWLCLTSIYSQVSILNLCWWYLVVKILDLLDTVFFVVTKKQDHVTTLHVFHHVSVVITVWLDIKYGVLGQNIASIVLNSLVHVIMYSYYFLTTLGPKVRRFLWWKKYLTALQIVQLVTISVHQSLPLFMDCGLRPKWLTILAEGELVIVTLMFFQFYCRTYNSKRQQLEPMADDHKKTG
ncbi:very long chain fatty acid elongase AAEL008004-like [Ornithodoros turicata]|uniref:very long chain fatty acid elongase AAEL008004-like n=1 Tax=Ornithodoros turicata TaxID=34597 RepID=UPI00313948A5